MTVYVDGGVRRGTDILKALCLGAKAVGLGRPFLYAQSVSTKLPSTSDFVIYPTTSTLYERLSSNASNRHMAKRV
jgi:hypothetical protein